jgi:flagellar hook-basal body complex protein FliE
MATERQQNRLELTSAEADVLQQMATSASDLNQAVRTAEATINTQVMLAVQKATVELSNPKLYL